MTLHPVVAAVTERIIERSRKSRRCYLALMERNRQRGIARPRLACGNLAHAIAASGEDKSRLMKGGGVNLGIITSYNDMLSAHQPYGRYPDQMKLFAREAGATMQVAGATAAMCDGVTQGQEGMELSLFSRDAIAMSTAIGLSHGMFEGVALLGICDKIVPGLLMGALRFGHLPAMLIPAGPMTSGLPNKEKQRVRQLYAEGKVDSEALMEAEAASYHSAGTCTFYGTANTNQMMVEIMGLMMPDSAFCNPGTRLRQAITRASVHRLAEISQPGAQHRSLAHMVDEKAIVNAAVGLLASGGSTNHAIHLPAIARAAGIVIDWEDLDRLSSAVPLLTRAYPNGSADVNAFNDAGGLPTMIAALCDGGFLHQDIVTVSGGGLADYARRARLEGEALLYSAARPSSDRSVLRDTKEPFRTDGGMRLVTGNLGRGIYKTSAVQDDRQTIEAPAAIFHTQEGVIDAFKAGALNRDVVVVVRFQGPEANGMPELHRLTPTLAVLQDRGHRVALLTDGRMSGASGKVPAAIHIGPEAQAGGPIALLRDGDMVRICARTGQIEALVDPAIWVERRPVAAPAPGIGTGRELFALMRSRSDNAERGGSAMLAAMEDVIDATDDIVEEDIMKEDGRGAGYDETRRDHDAVSGHSGSRDPGRASGASDGGSVGGGGLTTLEVTLRTPCALEAIAEMSRVEGALVGAGTVLNSDDLGRSVDAGARFIVSPGLTEGLARAAVTQDTPLLPGIANAGDIMRGLDMGLSRFKFFPAVANGGLPAIKALSAVFGQIRFCPTGGISEDTAKDWLALESVSCVGGSWLTSGAFDPAAIETRARAASALRG